jgi:hypothetical protein
MKRNEKMFGVYFSFKDVELNCVFQVGARHKHLIIANNKRADDSLERLDCLLAVLGYLLDE